MPDPHANHFGVVPPPPPETVEMTGLANRHARALAAIERIDRLLSQGAGLQSIGHLLARQEAVRSSAIEDTVSTVEEVLLYEETRALGPSPHTPLVSSYAAALEDLLPEIAARGRRAFSLATVRQTHKALMRGDPEYRDTPGELRRDVVWIGGAGDISTSTYNPPPPLHVEECLERTLLFMRDDRIADRLTLPLRMAVAHAHFEAVHPFTDGNGRVGRLLLPLMMAADGHEPLFLAGYMESRRDAYYRALQASSLLFDFLPIIEHCFDAIVAAADEAEATLHALQALRRIWLARAKYREGSAALKSLDVLLWHPVVTVDTLSAKLGVTWTAANRAAAQLQDRGVLQRLSSRRRNRAFVAREVLDIIERPFEHAPPLPAR